MKKRKVSNPLALVVLALLWERPMHPYEMVTTMRERGQEGSIKLNFGSLYTVVESLQRAGLIAAQGTVRQGRRPERTVYQITDAGATELFDWLCELLGEPAKEYPRFMAGLALLSVLPPAKAIGVLEQREQRLAEQVEQYRVKVALLLGSDGTPGLPRLFLIESEYEQAMREAELAWVRGLLRELRDGTLSGMDLWRSFHQHRTTPPIPATQEEGATRTP